MGDSATAVLDRGGRQPFSLRLNAALPVIALLGVYSMYNALAPRELPGQRQLYAVIFLLAGGAVFIKLRPVRFPRRVARTWGLWFLAIALAAIPITGQPVVYVKYIVGDIASLVLPVVFLACGVQYPSLFRRTATHVALATFLALAALLATAFPDNTGRYEPPSLLLIALVWVWVFTARTRASRMLAFLSLGALGAVAFASSVRTNAVSCVLAGTLLAILSPKGGRRLATLSFLIVVVTLALGIGRWQRSLQRALAETRFRSFVSGRVDESLFTRYLELRDVISTARREWTPINYVLGYGHGATYKPQLSLIERNLTPEGRVHNIHIGPALLAFRYGLTGLTLLLSFALLLARSLLQLRKKWFAGEVDQPYMVFTLGMALFAADFLLRNSITDPVFSYTVAGFLFMNARGMVTTAMSSTPSSASPQRMTVTANPLLT